VKIAYVDAAASRRVARLLCFGLLSWHGKSEAYHLCTSPQNADTRVPYPFRCWERVGIPALYAAQIETLSRPRGSALHHFQLLRATGVAGDGVCAQSVLEDSGAGAASLCGWYGWLRGHVGTCAPAVERTEKWDTGEIVASVEAARVARHARTQETQGQRATVTGLSRVARRTATILAAEILRLQRL